MSPAQIEAVSAGARWVREHGWRRSGCDVADLARLAGDVSGCPRAGDDPVLLTEAARFLERWPLEARAMLDGRGPLEVH